MQHSVSSQIILNQLHECKAEEFTQILHGLARIGYHPGDRFITAMAEGMMYKLGEFGTQVRRAEQKLLHVPACTGPGSGPGA